MTKTDMLFRVAYNIKVNSKNTRMRPYTDEQAQDLARELLESVNYKSLAAARREMHSNPRWRRIQGGF